MTPAFAHDLRRTLALGLPLAGGQVAQVLIGFTDAIMLGRYSVAALAAGSLGATVFFTVFVFGAGFAQAVMPVAASAAAQDDATSVRRATRMGLWLSAAFGVAIYPLFWFSGPILLALGQEEGVAADAQTYLRIAGLGMLPALLTATLRSHLGALERPRIVLWAVIAAGILNVGLNWVLIFGNLGAPELGVAGAAWASLGVHGLTTAILWAYALRGPGMAAYELARNPARPDWPVMGRLFRLGWPIGLTHLAEGSLFVASGLMMGWLGAVALAAHGVALQIASLVFMVHLGLSAAATIRVGRARGAGDADGLRRAALAAAILSGAMVVLATVFYWGAGAWVVSWFVTEADPDAPAILELGARLLVLAAVFQLVDAGQVMALGMLRGLQDTRVPMIYAVASYFGIGIPASYVLGFPLGLGPDGIWWGLVIGLTAASAVLTGRFLRLAAAPAAPLTSRS
jgi:MATE family multidrug resistance protein